MKATIYVELLREGTPCWRPVNAERLSGDTFRIVDPVPNDETWAFQPGQVVRCRQQALQDGLGLVAFESVNSTPVQRIVLTGFMGSGKSTVGPLLAERLGWRFIDADDVIVAETGMAIADFFARHGEPAFRARERETIARLATEDGLVLALGGGAIEDGATRQLLLAGPGTLLVHLEVTLETAQARCGGTEHTRPVLADAARLAARYEKRLPLYREAHVTVVVDPLTPEQVADAVARRAGPS
ncbi:MAG TPA: shikimate kinase [Terracidiphilus sp.]|nr:shikimate kinase [Terracidiphilus sp.]